MAPQLIRITAVLENGVLKPQGGPVPNLTDGDHVEIVLVRVMPDEDSPQEAARREQILKAFEEHTRQLVTIPPDVDDDYDVLEAMNATRLNEGARPLIPPTGER